MHTSTRTMERRVYDEGDVDAHVDLFSLWFLDVHQGQVAETRFLLALNDSELVDWSTCLHRENILPGVATSGTLPASLAILRSLAAGISRTSIRNPELFNRNHSFTTIFFTELIATV